MEKHQKKCPLEEVSCSNNCQKKVKKQHLPSHVKTECPRHKVSCQHCHQAGEQFINGRHVEECLKFLLSCPNNCEVGTITCEDMERHKEECPLEIISCSNNCGEKLERQYLLNHTRMECLCRNVYCQYCYDIGEHQFVEGEHKEECPKLPLPCPNK